MSHVYRDVHYNPQHHAALSSLFASLIGAFGGVVTLLLSLRFVLTALNVDRLSGFASFIFNASYPFVAPFFALFNYQPLSTTTPARFEYRTLIALLFWAAATWLAIRLITFDEED